MPTEAESPCNEAMLNSYRRAKAEAGYNATRFLSMVVEHGGLETARYLLHAGTVSEGYTALWEPKRLDLTVEAMVLRPEWGALFSDVERRIAVNRAAVAGRGHARGLGDVQDQRSAHGGAGTRGIRRSLTTDDNDRSCAERPNRLRCDSCT